MSQDEPNQTDQGVETGVAVGGGNSGTITVNKITNLGTSGSVIVAGGLVVVALILFMGINLLSSDDTATAVEEEVAGVEQNADEDTSSVRSGEPAAATDSEADGGAVADDNDQGVAPLEVVAEPAVATEPTPDPKFDTDRLSGLFNVAVLQFSTGDSDDASALYEAEDAADELVDFLRSELGPDAALSDIDIGYYERAEEREDLNKLAIDMNANMVVTATLRAEDGESVFSPEFLIPSGSLTEAEELSGFHALGLERRWNESFLSETVSTELRNVVKDCSQALVHLVRGLSAYRGKEYDRLTFPDS